MAQTVDDVPARWDLEWQPERGAGRPERNPPSLEAAYAESPLRALAFAFDVLLLGVVLEIAGTVRALLSFWLTRDNQAATDNVAIVSSALMFAALVVVSALAVYFWRVFRATPGQLLLGLFVLEAATGRRLRRRAAWLRWLLLYVPVTLVLAYNSILDVLFRTALFQPADPLLVASIVVLLPLAWYAVLAVSVLAEGRRGRGLHDRLAGSVVVRRAGPPA